MADQDIPHEVSASEIELFAQLALDGVQRETPHYLERAPHMKGKFADRSPREITPAFFGCYDWHSAVHSHWSLVRMMRCCPGTDWEPNARHVISRHLTHDHITQEIAYFTQGGMEDLELPYGLAWLLLLVAELDAWSDPDARQWRDRLRPLEELAQQRFLEWLPQLPVPNRSGMHDQTAFALGLLWDTAVILGNEPLEFAVRTATLRFYADDRQADIRLEPSPYDFLSPSLAVADLMRRMLPQETYCDWLNTYYVELHSESHARSWLPPVATWNPADGLSCHLDGLNTSRAWMLQGIAHHLSDDDPRRTFLLDCALAHQTAGLSSIYPEHYSGAHWLGTFAVYLITRRGLGQQR